MKNYKTFFVAAILFAVLTAIVAAYGFNSIAGTVDVLVAKQDITADKTLLPDQIGVGKTPKGAIQMDTIRTVSDLKGMVAKGYIPAGTVLRKSMFQTVATAGVRAKLTDGYVALAVEKNLDTSCSDQIIKNSRVNIKAYIEGAVTTVATNLEVIEVTEKGMVLAVPEATADTVILNKYSGKLVFELLPSKEGE